MVNIIKASGESAPFDPAKLHHSLTKIGVQKDIIEQIVGEVTRLLHEGMSTRDIYRIAFQRLRSKSRHLAAKYHLKRAIMGLGATGYPFEKYVAEILRHKGYHTENNQYIQGRCVSHEVDVVALKNNHRIYVECKYHNLQGNKSNVKIPLYVKARFDDILQKQKTSEADHVEMWLVTNTRFTNDALQYGNCAGLKLISWDAPNGNSLKDMIELSGLYPITCITQLTKTELTQLFENGIVLCQSIKNNPSVLNKLRIADNKKSLILEQCQSLCRNTEQHHL